VSTAFLADTAVEPFGRHAGHGLVACAAAAVRRLREQHPGLTAVDALWVGSARPGESEGWESGLAAAVAQATGLGGVAATDVRAFCASSNVAFIHAAAEIRAGTADVSLVVGVEHMSSYRSAGPLVPAAVPPWATLLSPPAFYALCASRYLHDYALDARVLAEVSVRNRARAVGNPAARFRTAVTVEEVEGSKPVSDPLTLLQCSAPGDGSGAALLVSETGARRLGLDVGQCAAVLGLGHASATDPDTANLVSFPEDMAAAGRAFRDAGLTPADIAVAEVHDAFTIAQVIHLEDLGLAGRGLGWTPGGDGLIVNPSGGLLGRSHPLGATGVAQLGSVRRERAGGAGFGLVHEAGGLQHLGQMISTVIILGPAASSEPT
jgi:acetyl-CoA acetyltransferase